MINKSYLILLVSTYLVTAPVRVPSPNFLERIDPDTGSEVQPTVLVLHYTVADIERVKAIFSNANAAVPVSAHYTVDTHGTVYSHVDETKAARHAGVSYWRGLEGADATKKKLNYYSVGIEHVNAGYRESLTQPEGQKVSGSDKEWYPFDDQQIVESIALCKALLARHPGIEPRNVVAHSDIAPGRKQDPGPLFPWKRFAQEGIGAWPDSSEVFDLSCLPEDVYENQERRTDWFIEHAALWGYRKPADDLSVSALVQAFQMHFRATCIDGVVDKETVDALRALLCGHLIKQGELCPCFP